MANESKKQETQSTDEGVMEKLDYAAEQVMDFSKSNKIDAAAFVVMVLGFFIAMFNPDVGAGIVGIVTGFYFGGEALSYVTNLNAYIEREGMFKSLVLGVATLLLFVALPYFFIGFAAVVGLKALLSMRGASTS